MKECQGFFRKRTDEMKNVEWLLQMWLDQTGITKECRILVACSGGPDSVALVRALDRLNYTFSIAHVNHMLRDNAKKDAQFVQELARTLGRPYYDRSIPIPAIALERKQNIQHVCRVERYSFLEEIMLCHSYDYLATAHHQDDQLETLLLQLSDGRKLLGMPEKRKRSEYTIIRPFQFVDKAMIYHYLEELRQPYRVDESNESDHYARNWMRQHIVPALKQKAPRISEKATELAKRAREDEQFLQQLAADATETLVVEVEEGIQIDVQKWQSYAPPLQRRIIPLLLNYLYSDNRQPHYEQSLLQLLYEQLLRADGTKFVRLPERYFFIRAYDRAYFVRTLPKEQTVSNVPEVLVEGKTYTYPGGTFQLARASEVESDAIIWYLPTRDVAIRMRQTGDRIRLNKGGTKKITRLMIDEKIPAPFRNNWPVLVDANDEVLGVIGVRAGDKIQRQPQTTDDYILIIDKDNE